MNIKTGLRVLMRQGPLALYAIVIDRLRETFYVPRARSYRLLDALLFPDGFRIDYWTRYSHVTQALKRYLTPSQGRWSILEVGAGGAGLASFTQDRDIWSRVDLVVADYDAWLLGSTRRVRPVLADAGALPFRDKSFDAVLAIDILEHLPPAVRN